MWHKLTASLVCMAVCISAAVAHAEEHTQDSLQTVKENIAAKKAVLVDVRDKPEWDSGHVKGAIFLPLRELKKQERTEEMLNKLPKDRILYTHCVVGMRSLKAAEILKKHGYKVRALKPGYDELIKAGFEGDKAKEEAPVLNAARN